MHPVYKKFITTSMFAHDADNRFKAGDMVRIRECQPISKSKSLVVYDTELGSTLYSDAVKS